jgi:hypothetical protein
MSSGRLYYAFGTAAERLHMLPFAVCFAFFTGNASFKAPLFRL